MSVVSIKESGVAKACREIAVNLSADVTVPTFFDGKGK
jgi:hypothetical protein